MYWMEHYLPLLRKFLAGAWLLMFWLYLFEESIKSLWWRHLKRLLEVQTKTIWKWMRAGTRISALTTSSTFVSLLLVAFVWAWLLWLHNAIGVVLWANIGTTLNSLWVAYMWFGEFKIAKYALPLIAIWWIIHMVTKNKTRLHIAHICIGIWLLFIGLDYMKWSVDSLAKSVDLTQYHNLRAFWIIWLIITALLHSQAAMQIITLAALNWWIIALPAAFAIIIWANIGTTMTALTAALWWSKAHKQVALAHFFQNVLAALLGILFFAQFQRFCEIRLAQHLHYQGNNVLATAWFNTLFNIVTAIPFILFPQYFARFIEYLTFTPWWNNEHHFMIEKFRWIWPVKHTLWIQLNALLQDCETIKIKLQNYIYMIINKQYDTVKDSFETHLYSEEERLEFYHQLKDDIDFLYNALIPLQESSLLRSDVTKMRKVEEILSLLTNTAKEYKSISSNLDELRKTKQPLFDQLMEHIDKQILDHTLDSQTSPSLLDIQQSFIPAITQAVQIPEIDIPTLVTTQHWLSQAYTNYKKLIEQFS
jgi:phosphate:Na+ symporter